MASPTPTTSKTLVLCFDGTSTRAYRDNTIAVHFFVALRKDDAASQLCYFQSGVPARRRCGLATWLADSAAILAAHTFTWNLEERICGGYSFLMDHYCPGDKLCMFGFSRGAYIARALAGMLCEVGLLPKGNYEQVTAAYELYKDRTVDPAVVQAFKDTFCIFPIIIDFVGVWDMRTPLSIFCQKPCRSLESETNIRAYRQLPTPDERRLTFHMNAEPNREACLLNNSAGSGKRAVEDASLNASPKLLLRVAITEALKADCGIRFSEDQLHSLGIDNPAQEPLFLGAPQGSDARNHRARAVCGIWQRLKGWRRTALCGLA